MKEAKEETLKASKEAAARKAGSADYLNVRGLLVGQSLFLFALVPTIREYLLHGIAIIPPMLLFSLVAVI